MNVRRVEGGAAVHLVRYDYDESQGREPDTSGREGLEDVRLQIDIIKGALRRDTSRQGT